MTRSLLPWVTRRAQMLVAGLEADGLELSEVVAGFRGGRKHGGFVFHNTRHTAMTHTVNARGPPPEAMTVSRHRARSVFDRYSLSLKQQTKAALRRVTEYTQQQDTTPTIIPVQRQVHRGGGVAVTAPAAPWPSAS